MMATALRKCREGGHNLSLEDMASHKMDGRAIADHLANSGLDGLIISPMRSLKSDLLTAISDNVPRMVMLGARQADEGFARVSFDERAGAKKLTGTLIALGHKRIGFISGEGDCASAKARREGFVEALEDANLPVDESLIVSGEYTVETGMSAGMHLLDLKTPPSAIFCANDDMAAGVILAAHRKGMSLPEDLSVVGFEDTAIAKLAWPQLTTIRQPIARMTEIAVDYLSKGQFPSDLPNTRMLDDTHLQITDMELIERKSVASL